MTSAAGRDHYYGDGTDDWRDQALCAQTDPELFFPEYGMPGRWADAKKVCGRCPVQVECLADALVTDERYGIQAGLTRRERNRLRDQHKAAG